MKHESDIIHLVCISTKGDRFYFSTNMGEENNRPEYLQLLHINFFSQNQTDSVIHESFYSKDVFIFSESKKDKGIYINNLLKIR